MEATLQKTKPKKHRQKPKQHLTDLPSHGEKNENKSYCSLKVTEKEIEKEVVLETKQKKSNDVLNSDIELQSNIEAASISNVKEEKLKVCESDIHENDTAYNSGELSVKKEVLIAVKYPDIKTFQHIETLSSEKLSIKNEILPAVRYPDLKALQQCGKVDNIVSSQVLVDQYTTNYINKVLFKATEAYNEFVKEVHCIDKHPLLDMTHLYRRTKRSYLQNHSSIKYLKSDFKRKKDSLWKTIKKEVNAKGKCEDGYTVNIKHVYTIKELDQDKFNELIQILHEIEQLLLTSAFYSYSEELVKLRIEHYISNVLHQNKNILTETQNSYVPFTEDSVPEIDSDSLKKSISVLFDSQRQNVEDKHYLETCQEWLKMLVSTLNQKTNFKNNLFLLNHVIRCPNGVKNWASQFVQIPVSKSKNTCQRSEEFECLCAEQILLALFLIMHPVPDKDYFLRNIKNSTAADCVDGKFIVLDSEGEEEETVEISKNWSDHDVVSLLNQIPIRSLFNHFLIETKDEKDCNIKMESEGRLLKLFAYSTAIIDILCKGLETHYSENFPSFFESVSNLIRHVLIYISEYYTHHVTMNSGFKSEVQAVYDRFFFHVVFKIYNFEKLRVLKILPALPYNYISRKMLWNVMWIFFHPGKSEKEIYSEKDVEVKIKDEIIHSSLLNHIKNFPTDDLVYLLNTFEKFVSSNGEDDFVKFALFFLFKITVLEVEFRKKLFNEGSILLSSVCSSRPSLVSTLLRYIDEADNEIADQSTHLFKKMDLSVWIPEDSDISIISSWLLSNLAGKRHLLARLILKKMNFGFSEEGSLFLPYDLHRKIAILITEAYLLFDANNSDEGLISKGVKQMLQFTALGVYEDEREDFVSFAWHILFSLKLHPLDRKNPPLVEVYDGSIPEDKKNSDLLTDFKPLVAAYESKHPAGCYLMIVMTNEGYSMKSLLKIGLKCLQSLIENEQYIAAIKSLYYILPFFVKHSEDLLDKSGFLKALHLLITADLTVISSITGPVNGAVLSKVAAMVKHQIYKAGEQTIEFSAPLLKLWIKILMKLLFPTDKDFAYMSKNSAKQIHFLLDLLVKISSLHDYTRICISDLFDSYCSPNLVPRPAQSSLLKRWFSSDSTVYPILNQCILPEYPWLAWYVLMSEMKQKLVQDLWCKVQAEMLKQKDASPATCLKKMSDGLKVELEFLPIYRWAKQAVKTPATHPVSPLIYQQFFLCYFHQTLAPNSISIGIKYFKSGPFVPLLKEMKQHLADAVSHYKNLIKFPNKEPGCMQASKSSESDNSIDNGFRFYFILLKLYEAFQLWIDDESLQNSKICLSALEPKYCPERLELILKGDQTLWIDLVSFKSLKEEIDTKVQSFYYDKIITHSQSESNYCSDQRETLSSQMKRHLENYETVLPSVKTEPCTAVFAYKDGNSTSVSFTKEAIQGLIEQNQHIIFDKAKFFCKQMEKLKQLNFNFINLTPQEYKVEPCEKSETKVCYKGSGENGCSGAAFFKLQIEKYSRNGRIAEKIENNRADYVLVHDELTKLPLKDLCYASLKIENFIRSLAKEMRQSHNGSADYLRKMGIALFYQQISTIDETLSSVEDYPPSRQFFSSIIESLGEEFIDGEESELKGLAKSILKHPKSGILALPLFNPNKASVQNFIDVMETLTSSVNQHCSNTLLSLFSKIEYKLWLQKNSPNFDDRKKIFECVCQALLSCGANPITELLPVFEILKQLFRITLKYMFPDLFPEAVEFLLSGIENKNLSTDICYEAFHCFGCPLFSNKTSVNDIEYDLRKFAENQHLSPDQQIFISVVQLNLLQVRHVSHLLHNHFMSKRLLKKQDFYKDYASYVHPVGIFLAIISHSLISLQLGETANLNTGINLADLWDIFHLPFLPWIHPTQNTCGLDFPWTDNELSLATYMMKIFSVCTKYFHERILTYGCEESVLSCLWNFYIQVYVVPGYRHYSTSVCHTELLNLPWNQFHPCTQDIEGMCKVLQSTLDESKEFLSAISLKIAWSEVMQKISMTKSPDYVGKVLATLGKLLIISQMQPSKETENNLSVGIFKEFEDFSWNYLCIEDVESLLDLFYEKLDCASIFTHSHTSAEFYVLQFLKQICGIGPSQDPNEYSNNKRILCLQKFFLTMGTYCNSNEGAVQKKLKEFKDILRGLLAEVESSICNGVNPNEQTNFALPLLKEFIVFLNSLPSELETAAVDSIIVYLSENKQSPLLLPCLKVSSSDLQSVSHMVLLIECCLSTRFFGESLDSHEVQNIWQLISSYFCIRPSTYEDFVKKCVQEQAYLTLYCNLLHKLPLCDNTEKKKSMLKQIVLWIRESHSKLSSNSEAKFLLLWDRILELSIKLVAEEEYQVVKQELMSFSWILETLAEDRLNSGFFAVIGFGQASSLSVNFRFICRVMIAFIQKQFPDNCVIRMESTHVGLVATQPLYPNVNESEPSKVSEPQTSSSALKALNNLKALEQKKLYTALQSQINYAVQYITDSKYTLMQSRELLKYFAAVLYPKDSYLAALDT